MKRITVITPVYNEEKALAGYVESVKKALLSSERHRIEVLFVDDGSTDGSWQAISAVCGADPRFSAIRLSRNMGAHVADTAGLSVADGDAVAILACDLQDPPEVIHQFIEKWEAGAQIVWGARLSRQDSLWQVLASRVFNTLIRRYSLPKGTRAVSGGFLLADRKVVECFRRFGERNRVVFALFGWTGFRQEVVGYERRPRKAGKSGWTLRRMFKSAYDVIFGYSPIPVRMITVVGIGTSLIAILLAAYLVYSKLTGSPLVGWTGIMTLVTTFFGVQFLLTGFMGEYLYRIYSEVLQRPLFFVAETAGKAPSAPAQGPGGPEQSSRP